MAVGGWSDGWPAANEASAYLQTMTDPQKVLVRESWAAIEPKQLRFIDLLYEEFFSAEPQLRILFEGPMDAQHLKLADLFTRAVEQLDDPGAMVKELQTLGHRHDDYGVEPHHFMALGDAFQRALRRMLGERYTPEVGEAWAAFYERLSQGMQGKRVMV